MVPSKQSKSLQKMHAALKIGQTPVEEDSPIRSTSVPELNNMDVFYLEPF